MNIPFEEVVCCDSEFYGREGNRPTVVCLVAKELRSGREFRLWQDQLPSKPPYRIDSQTLFVAHYAAAEMCCHLALGWDLPVNILDTYAEFRCCAGRPVCCMRWSILNSTVFRCRQKRTGAMWSCAGHRGAQKSKWELSIIVRLILTDWKSYYQCCR